MFFEGIGNTVHLLAAAGWIGGLAFLALLAPPVLRRVLGPETAEKVQERLQALAVPLSVAGVAVLGGTGVMMMTQDTHFEGWGVYDNVWSRILVAKHVVFLIMTGVTVALWRIRRSSTRKELLDICFWLGVTVLILTGFLTALE